MKLTLKDLFQIKGAEIINKKYFKPIREVSIDSRKISKGALFFAIKGENFDGHDFVKAAVEKGASAISVQKSRADEFINLNTLLIAVDDTTTAIGDLANIYRKKFNCKIIGISGSNGKTTTKEMTAKILSTKYNVIKTEGNLNNYYGVPLTLFRLNDKHEFAVVEMGINHPGEMTRLCEIAEPDFGCITNVANAHVEFFGGLAGVAKSKGEMFRYLESNNKLAFVNSDDKQILRQAKGLTKKFTFGFNSHSDVKGKYLGLNKSARPKFNLSYKNSSADIQLNTYGKYSVLNALCAAAIGMKFGIGIKKTAQTLEKYQTLDKRMQVIYLGSATIINDSYNANPDSMKAAFETLKLMKGFETKIAVIGDMLELGEKSKDFHKKLAYFAKSTKVDHLLCYGEMVEATYLEAKKLNIDSFFFSSKSQLVEKLNELLKPSTLVLLKGSRKMKMEEILTGIKKI